MNFSKYRIKSDGNVFIMVTKTLQCGDLKVRNTFQQELKTAAVNHSAYSPR